MALSNGFFPFFNSSRQDVTKSEFELLIQESHRHYLNQLADRYSASTYDFEEHGELPYMLTKNRGGQDWQVNKYVIR